MREDSGGGGRDGGGADGNGDGGGGAGRRVTLKAQWGFSHRALPVKAWPDDLLATVPHVTPESGSAATCYH